MNEIPQHSRLTLLALRFFRWFCDPAMAEDIEGDLLERFEIRSRKRTLKKARWLLVRDIGQLFKPGIIRPFKIFQKLNNFDMFKHNLLISLRGFKRHKNAFFINLLGLSSGLACALFILLWVRDEKQMDKFHALDSQLYQVLLHHEESGNLRTEPYTQAILAEALEADVPEIKVAIQGTPAEWFGLMPLTIGDKTVKATGKFMDPRYFELFTYPLVHGTADKVLDDKNSIVISETLAISLFGDTEKAIGQSLDWNVLQWSGKLMVSGVFEDVPFNSTDQFEFVLSFERFRDMLGEGAHWGNYNSTAYALLERNTDVEALNAKLGGFVKEKSPGSNVNVFLRPYSDQYLYSKYENGVLVGGRIEYVRLFSVIAIFILAIASINFMNLATAKATRKMKEIGVKKAIGAKRGNLIAQYLEESLLLTFISALLALGMVWLLLPQFNIVTDKQISLSLSADLLLPLLGIVLFTGLISGSYPALYLSGFKPVAILKGKLNHSLGEIWARKGLVVFQFVISVTLIVSVLVVYRQIEFVQNKNLGYEKEQLLIFGNEGQLNQNLKPFMAEVKNIPSVVDVAASSHPIVTEGGFTTGVEWEGKDPQVDVRFGYMSVSGDFINTLGLEIVEGRNFNTDQPSDIGTALILNETAIQAMGLENPLESTIKFWGNDARIVGVMKDFHFTSLHKAIEPVILRVDDSFLQNIVVRVVAGQEANALERLEAFYKQYNPGYIFDYRFLDQDYQKQYAAEQRISVLSRYFAGAAVIISCLGLFGLAAFTAERKTKEIGVRKALGASTTHIVRLLSGDFNRMVGLAILIALPLSYYLIQSWLDGFAYHIELSWLYFAGAGVLALFIAWLTVSIQTFKAAKTSPVKSLRSE